jgi:sugar lactone lactonase YvrE
VKNSEGIYVSCLDGYIHYLDKDPSGEFRISKSLKAGSAVTGLALSEDNTLFAVIYTCPLEEWKTTGGSVYRVDAELNSAEKISENFPAMNGICFDGLGNLYFTSSNFNFINPEGKIFRMNRGIDGAFGRPVPYFENVGLANGLYYDATRNIIYFSNTTGGIYEFTPGDSTFNEVYLKLKFMESCDDLCSDISGNIWMTDPGQATVKMYNPGTGRLFRFNIEGFGQASSCRIRSENGMEMIYISELSKLNKPMSQIFNGRGVLAVPAQTLLKLMEPVLINKTSE